MAYIIIDTETSGLFDFSKPADAEGQPRLASLSMLMVDDDLNNLESDHFFIKPEGWELTKEVSDIHGLTMEFLNANGVPVADALNAYAKAIDEGHIVVAFNAQYDTKIMRGEMRRAGIEDRFERTPNLCVMRELTNICKVPRKTGKGFKFPKLSEACAHFEIVNEGEHSAHGDALACLHLLRKMKESGPLPVPTVHYAKVAPAKPMENAV